MNIVHFSQYDKSGGSARSAWRIHRNLLELGHNSRMLVGTKSVDDELVGQITSNEISRKLDITISKLLNSCGLQYRYVPSSNKLLKHSWVANADIIQAYNLHGGYVSMKAIEQIGLKIPIVWRLSDLWPITGHCAYPGDCKNWISGCVRCPDLNAYPSIGVDTASVLWNKKRGLFENCDITVVAPSSWAYKCATDSPMLQDVNIELIHNGIDLSCFEDRNRLIARKFFRMEEEKVAILFIAEKSYPNSRKGSHILEAALNYIGYRDDLVLITAGHRAERWIGKVPIPVYPLGPLLDSVSLANAYAAADIVCALSIDDNLPNTAIEALASARPLIGFDTGGITDAIIDGSTGLLADTNNIYSVAEMIMTLVRSNKLRLKLGNAGLTLAKTRFCASKEAACFNKLYDSILARRR